MHDEELDEEIRKITAFVIEKIKSLQNPDAKVYESRHLHKIARDVATDILDTVGVDDKGGCPLCRS